MDKSMNGYLMRHILQQIVGPQRQISFGMIYPLFERLAKAGYITLHEEPQTGKRPSKVATVTAAGRQRFYDLMTQAVPVNPNAEFTYGVKFRNFHQSTPALQIQILTAYRAYLTDQRDFLVARIADLPVDKMRPAEYRDAQRVLALDKSKTEAALTWANTTLKEVTHDQN